MKLKLRRPSLKFLKTRGFLIPVAFFASMIGGLWLFIYESTVQRFLDAPTVGLTIFLVSAIILVFYWSARNTI